MAIIAAAVNVIIVIIIIIIIIIVIIIIIIITIIIIVIIIIVINLYSAIGAEFWLLSGHASLLRQLEHLSTEMENRAIFVKPHVDLKNISISHVTHEAWNCEGGVHAVRRSSIHLVMAVNESVPV